MTKDEKLLAEALKRFDAAQTAEQEIRELAVEDFRFAAGEQWPSQVKDERDKQNRPCLTFNRLPQFIRQVTGSARQNKPAIKVIPVDSGSDIELADIINGLIRNIETQSRAEEAYMTALENAVTGGIGGGWRICTEYSNDDSFDQDIRIKRINNPFAIYWDTNAKEFDKSDANWCFVSEWVSKEEFEAKYPKEAPQNWKEEYTRLDSLTRFWVNDDRVRLAEYWVKTPIKKRIGLLNGQVLEIKPGLESLPWEMQREVDSYKVERYLLSGHAVLDGPKEFPSKWIPIIPCYGPEEWIDDRVRYVSLIRYAKDPMRMYNFWQSAIAEKIALAPKSPWLVTPAMIAGLEQWWNRANLDNAPYLPYNPDATGNRPARQEPAYVNAAEIQQSAQAVDDLKATMGMYDASIGAQGNETSGRAIIARQREGDNATFAWIDNLARAIQHTGRIFVDIIPKIYDTQRVVRILGEDGSQNMVQINTVVGDTIVNDLSIGKYDVEVTTGPSYRTRRIEASESWLALSQAMPQVGQVASDVVVRNLDLPGSDEVADRLKKSLPPQITEEGDPMPPPPDPMMEMEMAKRQAEIEGKQLDNADKQVELSIKTGQLEQLVAAEVQRVLSGMIAPPEMIQPY